MRRILPDMLSPRAVADAVGCHPQTIRRMEDKGLVPLRQQVGGMVYRVYLPSAVELARRLLAERRRKN